MAGQGRAGMAGVWALSLVAVISAAAPAAGPRRLAAPHRRIRAR